MVIILCSLHISSLVLFSPPLSLVVAAVSLQLSIFFLLPSIDSIAMRHPWPLCTFIYLRRPLSFFLMSKLRCRCSIYLE